MPENLLFAQPREHGVPLVDGRQLPRLLLRQPGLVLVDAGWERLQCMFICIYVCVCMYVLSLIHI